MTTRISGTAKQLAMESYWDGWLAALDEVERLREQIGTTAKAVAALRQSGQRIRAELAESELAVLPLE